MNTKNSYETIRNELEIIIEQVQELNTTGKSSYYSDNLFVKKNNLFNELLNGENLPFFRQYYIEISEHLFSLLRNYSTAFKIFKNIKEDSFTKDTLLNLLLTVLNGLLLTWVYFKEDISKASKELNHLEKNTLKLQEIMYNYADKNKDNFLLVSLLNKIDDNLSVLILSIKKYFVVKAI